MTWNTPATAVTGELTSAFWNAQVRDNLKAIGDAWTSYTPTLSNWGKGNGTMTGAYSQAGKLVTFRAKLTFGSSTSVSGSPNFSLPVEAVGSRTAAFSAMAYDTSATAHAGIFAIANTSTQILFRSDASALLSATVPFAWDTGDELYVSGTYEAA